MEEAQGQDPTQTAQAATGGQTETQTEPQGEQASQADNELTKVRQEAAANRVKAREAEKALAEARAKLEEFEKQKLSELERAQLEAKEAKEEAERLKLAVRSSAVREAVTAQAVAQKAADPSIVVDLLAGKQWEFDDDGKPKDVEKAVKDLLAAKPILLGNTTGASPTNATKTTSTPSIFATDKRGSDVLFGS